jgi:hypothetical protein
MAQATAPLFDSTRSSPLPTCASAPFGFSACRPSNASGVAVRRRDEARTSAGTGTEKRNGSQRQQRLIVLTYLASAP